MYVYIYIYTHYCVLVIIVCFLRMNYDVIIQEVVPGCSLRLCVLAAVELKGGRLKFVEALMIQSMFGNMCMNVKPELLR